MSLRIEDGIVHDVVFDGGCSGNTQGVSRLIEGYPVAEAIARLKGIRCGVKDTSCPDQLARALERASVDALKHQTHRKKD